MFDAYGWPHDLTDEQILERLVALNAERAAEEARGIVRWLRPEFQNPAGDTQTTQKRLDLPDDEPDEEAAPVKKPAKVAKAPWPEKLSERFAALTGMLAEARTPLHADEVASRFVRAQKKVVAELLETLAALGNVRELPDGRYVA